MGVNRWIRIHITTIFVVSMIIDRFIIKVGILVLLRRRTTHAGDSVWLRRVESSRVDRS